MVHEEAFSAERNFDKEKWVAVIELRYLHSNRWMHKVVIGIIYFFPTSLNASQSVKQIHASNEKQR